VAQETDDGFGRPSAAGQEQGLSRLKKRRKEKDGLDRTERVLQINNSNPARMTIHVLYRWRAGSAIARTENPL